MKTIAEILLECEEGDKIKDDSNNVWNVVSRYEEDETDQNQGDLTIVVIAMPELTNTKKYELWSVGLECDVCMNGLEKVL